MRNGVAAWAVLLACVFFSAAAASAQPTITPIQPGPQVPPLRNPPNLTVPRGGPMHLSFGAGIDFDVDPIWGGPFAGASGIRPGLDIYLFHRPGIAGRNFLIPGRGAQLSTTNRTARARSECAAGIYSEAAVEVNPALSGASVCIRTTAGKYALLQVNGLSAPTRPSVNLVGTISAWP